MAPSPVVIAAFATLSAVGLYTMRIAPTQSGAPIGFDDIIKNGHLNVPFQHIKIPQKFTGIKYFDLGLATLIAAFSHGPLRLDEDAYWQQMHFLLGFFSIIAVMTVEANRERNRGTILIYTSIWALFYQTVAGAVIVPLFYLCHLFISSRPGYLQVGHSVPYPVARALIPALVLGYLVPTILMYIPWLSEQPKLYLIAIWQFSPILVNLLIGIISKAIVDTKVAGNNERQDSKSYINGVYLIAILTSVISHWITLGKGFFGGSSHLTFSSVFIPYQSRLLKSTGQDFHNIFQWDWLVIAIATFIWAWYVMQQVKVDRAVMGARRKIDTANPAYLILLFVLVGPGGMLALAWWERENALGAIQQDDVRKKT